MKIAIGSDHRGFALKKALVQYLQNKGYMVEDMGTYSEESTDYPVFAFKVAKGVAKRQFDRGILICNSGLGMAMAASTVKGVRAANCFNLATARFSREHNDANILVLGAGFVKQQMAKRITAVWLNTKFAGGRHLRRVKMFSK
ncbi:MAG: ribose 5-phosphate isomerase B [Candidatus Omnitrophica bacterium]|nr:ribose 5-phosphate isomerase B [Candidatus Omnitrophota bacterium]